VGKDFSSFEMSVYNYHSVETSYVLLLVCKHSKVAATT